MAEEHDELLSWASSVGITDNDSHGVGTTLRIHTFPEAGGRGFAAARDIKKGEIILRVPHAILLGVHTAKKDLQLQQALNSHDNLSSKQILALHLLNEAGKGPSSLWYIYLKYLPRAYHTLSHFSQFQAETLEAEDAIWAAKKSYQTAYSEWKLVQSVMQKLHFSLKFASFKAWLWAIATVSSRSMYVPWDEAGVLCPIGDLFNYDPGDLDHEDTTSITNDTMTNTGDNQLETSGWKSGRLQDGVYDFSLHVYCFYARRDYMEGCQVFLCYGQYDNLELLDYYGFLLPDNPNDAVYIEMPSPSEFGQEKDDIRNHNCGKNGCFIHVDGKPSFCLLASLRLRAAPLNLVRSYKYLALQGLQMSVGSDVQLYSWLSSHCRKMLEVFSTSLQEDSFCKEVLDTCHTFSEFKQLLCHKNIKMAQEWTTFSEELQKKIIEHLKLVYGPVCVPNDVYVYRLKLSTMWKLGYKAILLRCISHCKNMVNELQLPNR